MSDFHFRQKEPSPTFVNGKIEILYDSKVIAVHDKHYRLRSISQATFFPVMMKIQKSFVNELKNIRKSLGLTQKDASVQALISMEALRKIEWF
ncbi:transcriptional regulator [Thermoanaerobacter kivui]|uniref:transcriptional regulator n=1 Tax=Thermoanaerobacter kivui TaxID=2325 RepID=UPI000670E837|nr:transcriptional regulator [Thermoanaerobacter kivui]